LREAQELLSLRNTTSSDLFPDLPHTLSAASISRVSSAAE